MFVLPLTLKEPVIVWSPLNMFEPVVAKMPFEFFWDAVKAFIEALNRFNDAVAACKDAVSISISATNALFDAV